MPEKKNQTLPKVAIVILNYNGSKHLATYLPSVLQTSYANHEIIIADNGSTDDSVLFLKKHYPNITILDLKENTGFAAGYNLALQSVEADYYMLLNSDVEVMPNWLDPLVAQLQKSANIAAIQPKVLSFIQKDTFEHAGAAGGYLDYLGYPFCRGRRMDFCEKDEGQHDTLAEVFWATGAALLIRAEAFHQMEGFDGDYFAHMEEIDLCWRLKRAGYKIYCEPQSVVYHLGGGTLPYNSSRKVYLNFRNSLFTIFKNETSLKLLWLLPVRLLLDGLAGALFLVQGKWSNISAIIRAHWAFFLTIPKWYKKRKYYQKLITKARIGSSNTEGRYKGSIVWDHFVKNSKK